MTMSACRMRVLTWSLLAVLPATALAEVGNPDHTIYGRVTIFDQPAAAGTAIELRSARDGTVVAHYELGRDPRLDGRFALRIVMDDAGSRTTGRARPGDPVRAFVGGRLAAETTVGAQGVAIELDLDPKNMGNVPTLDVANVATLEGQSGNTTMSFTVSLSASSEQPAKVDWATREGSAIGGLACGPGVDFVSDQGTATVPAGATAATFAVIACGDAAIEPDETYFIDLSAVDNALAARSEVTATILDDDDEVRIGVADLAAPEPQAGAGPMQFEVTLSRPSPVNVSFTFSTQDMSALAGSDYSSASGQITLPAGTLTASIAIPLLADAAIEPDEQFKLLLSDPINAQLARSEVLGTILDPRFKPEVAQEDVELGGEGGIGDLAAPSAIALSPDGKQLYALGLTQNALLQFDRGSDGKLAFVRSYTTQSAGFGSARLAAPRDLELSADGKFVYVAATGDAALSVFARDAVSGDLSFVQFQHEGDADPDAVGGVVLGLEGALALALSSDASQLYVASGSGDSLAVYARDAATGRVHFVEVERHGVDDAGDAGAAVASLDDPSGVAVSSDGAQVYVAVRGSGAVARFDRNAADGRVAFAAAWVDGADGVDGIGGATSLALSPDGAQLYVTGGSDNAIALFDRAGDGALAWRKQFRKGDADLPGLGGVRAVRVAPDGKQVFATGFADDSFVVFARGDDGDLVPRQTILDGQGTVTHLAGPVTLEPSADDLHVYVVAQTDNALLMFRRLASSIVFEDGFESPPAGR
jgi:6-phosphogluconolactonase (cycloisomerase 2 family)